MDAKPIRLNVNGRDETVLARPLATLQDVLRDTLELTAVKSGCAQGGCGSCSVLIDGQLRLSCLTTAARLEGAEVVTLEGLDASGAAASLQQAFVENHAAQCGYCTAGMIVAAKALLDRNPSPPATTSWKGFRAISAAAPGSPRSSGPWSRPPLRARTTARHRRERARECR